MAARKQPRGLMAFWADIEEGHVEGFREWHNCEHMAERCAVPGFAAGRRYNGIGGAPMFLMYYETDDAAVLASEAYHARLNDPTPWTRAVLPRFRNADRNVFALLAEAGAAPETEPPYVTTCRFDLDPGREEEAAAWHSGPWLEGLAARDGVARARLYRIDEGVSGIATRERESHGGGPGDLRYLALLETAGRECPGLDDPGPFARLRERREAFWLDMALYPPAG